MTAKGDFTSGVNVDEAEKLDMESFTNPAPQGTAP